jgi:RNA-directed DNA polymerase
MSKTPADLAQILGIPLAEIEQTAKEPASSRFRYKRQLVGKKVRLLRIAKPRLRRILDAILKHLLKPMPLPPTMHGWRKRRSPKTYAKPHLRSSALINIDVQDYFPSVNGGRVHAFWMRAGFTDKAAKLLTSLTVCANQLPQGFPTSQAIGNQVLVPLDRRLNRLAAVTGARFGMYGDEFTLSGRRRVGRLKGLAARIVEQEGFKVNTNKIKDPDRSEKQEIAGIIVNRKPSLGREPYRQLRAIIHNCVTKGPASQNKENLPNFREHLRGHVSHLQQINPKLGHQLLAEFDKIVWE